MTITAEEFKRITGHEPVNDDLERCNCPEAGKIMHHHCGMCSCGWPRFMCGNPAHTLQSKESTS